MTSLKAFCPDELLELAFCSKGGALSDTVCDEIRETVSSEHEELLESLLIKLVPVINRADFGDLDTYIEVVKEEYALEGFKRGFTWCVQFFVNSLDFGS